MPKVKKSSSKQPRTPRAAPRKRARPAPKGTRKAAASRPQTRAGLDPRLVAAIGLALHDEQTAVDRAAELQAGPSPWTALGRLRVARSAR